MIDKKNIATASVWLVNKEQDSRNLSEEPALIFIA
jgi:hypothetical protein